jgi:hypothetical protein
MNRPQDGESCNGCGLPNYSGLCPVCRGDQQAYEAELAFAFGHCDEESLCEQCPKECIACHDEGGKHANTEK